MANEKQRKTFISYSRVNKDFALRLARELKSEGFAVWLDQLDIPAGARWDVELETALEECEIFMIIMTPSAIASENVRDEIGYAIDNNKRFLPVLLENCNVPLRLRRFQYVDFTNKSFDDGVNAAKELLRGLIAQPTIPRGVVVSDLQAEADRQAKEQAKKAAQAEADRKVKEEADRLAGQTAEAEKASKAEADRLARQKAEAEKASKAEADHLARQKAETEKAAQAEADRKVKEEADRLARQKAEADRKEKEDADRLAGQKAAPVESKPVAPASQKKPMSKGLIFGVIGVVVIAVCGIGYGIISSFGPPAATEAPIVAATSTKVRPTATDAITGGNPPAQPTLTKQPTAVQPTINDQTIASNVTGDLDGLSASGVEFKQFAFDSDGDWVVLYNYNDATWNGIPDSAADKIIEFNGQGLEINSITFAPDDTWLLLYNANDNWWWSDGFNTDISDKLQELYDGGHFIKQVAITSDGGWVVLHDYNDATWNGIPDSAADKIVEFHDQGLEINSITFAPDNTWLILYNANDSWWWSDGFSGEISDLLGGLHGGGAYIKQVAFAPDFSWVVLFDQNGYVVP